MLRVDPIVPSPRRRLIRLDLETTMGFMNIMFCLLTTSVEYRRAIHSLQLDESVLGCPAELTGDEAFSFVETCGIQPDRPHQPGRAPRNLFARAVIHEYIHSRLLYHANRMSLASRVAMAASDWRARR